MYIWQFSLLLIFSFSCFSTFSQEEESVYSGAENCAQCHQNQYKEWRESHHFNSMHLATSEYVEGDFSDKTVTFHDINTRLYKNDTQYLIDTLDQNGTPQTFTIKYTFGYYPLQQYLVELEEGHIQALNIAWDSRPENDGGQRWFHLRPEEAITTEHPFYWTRHFQNWNGRCSNCHSTNINKNYNQERHSFNTTWSEINVSCEACHGPGGNHINLINAGNFNEGNTGFKYRAVQGLRWQFEENTPIAKPEGDASEHYINMCGSCHSLRTQLSEGVHGLEFHDSNLLQLPSQPNYFADGQIREEVFVIGSFLQSKMYTNGVTCMNCHSPHSNKVLIEGNGLCAQCHKSNVYDSPQHHHHQVKSVGAQCVNCHMPERTYMQVDNRRDHSFGIPRPGLSQDLGVPNACIQCHKDRDNQWAIASLDEWGIAEDASHWAYIGQRSHQGDVSVTPAMSEMILGNNLPTLTKASLLSSFSSMPSQTSVEVALRSLQDNNPVIRRAAVSSLENIPPSLRWQVLSMHLDDPSKSVRFEIARVLADQINQVPAAQGEQLSKLIAEYKQALLISADSPATQLSIASLETHLGNNSLAEQAYNKALLIEPNFVPALINLADFYRSTNNEAKVEPLLERALIVAPESGAAQHSYGLSLVRKQRYKEALPYLKAAVDASDALSRYAYVYAVALDNDNSTINSINVLIDADKRWPNQYDVLMTLVLYLEKTGMSSSIPPFIAKLQNLAPEAPEVQRLIERYR